MGRSESALSANRPRRARRAPESVGSTLVIACPPGVANGRFVEELHDAYAICEVTERKALEHVLVNLRPDMLIVDLALPGLRRIRGLREIRRLNPATKTLVMTSSPAEGEGAFALKAGARGYCGRNIEPQVLAKAVAVIQNGEIWASRKLVRVLIGELAALLEHEGNERVNPLADPRLDGLTERQRLVAYMISRGASNKEIGTRLNICERTVKAHVTQAFRNAGVTDRLRLALLLLGNPQAPAAD